jgi:hypothetical protein
MGKHREKLGEPDIDLSGLQIWVHGREFPSDEDYQDADWINVTAHCGAQGASVWVSGNIIRLSEIEHLMSGAKTLYKNLKGKAELPCIEPELFVELEAKSLGQISMTVKITPDHLSQSHQFIFDVDQSYLPKLITSSDAVLKKFPIKRNHKTS